MSVSAIIVTRGDVDLAPVVGSLPYEWERVVWDNGAQRCYTWHPDASEKPAEFDASDLGVYGRYAAIEHATHNVIFVMDDDIVFQPGSAEAIVERWHEVATATLGSFSDKGLDFVVCNMPANFRARHFYDEHSLVGFGAAFHRDAPKKAFNRFEEGLDRLGKPAFFHRKPQVVLEEPERPTPIPGTVQFTSPKVLSPSQDNVVVLEDFWLTCDIVFTGLTPRVLVDVPYDDCAWASADNRMWKQPWHQGIRNEMLELVLKVRDLE